MYIFTWHHLVKKWKLISHVWQKNTYWIFFMSVKMFSHFLSTKINIFLCVLQRFPLRGIYLLFSITFCAFWFAQKIYEYFKKLNEWSRWERNFIQKVFLSTWEIFHDIFPFVELDSVPLKITTTSLFP